MAHCVRGGAEVDLGSLSDFPIAFFKKLFESVNTFYNEEPWTILGPKLPLTIKAFTHKRVFRIYAYEEDMILLMFTDYKPCMGFLTSGEKQVKHFRSGKTCSCALKPFTSHSRSNQAFIKKRKLTVTGKYLYPVFKNCHGGHTLSNLEMKMFELALAEIPKFVNTLIPSGPYVYKLNEIKKKVLVMATGEEEAISLIYPSGETSPDSELINAKYPGKWPLHDLPFPLTKHEYYSLTMQSLGKVGLPSADYLATLDTDYLKFRLRLYHIDTTNECYEKSDFLAAAANQRLRKPSEFTTDDMNKIENRIKELLNGQTELFTLEALSLTKMLCQNSSFDQRSAHFLYVHIYLDLHLYDELVTLMGQVDITDTKTGTLWMWTSTLLIYKKMGAQANSSENALKRAIRQNPWVFCHFAKVELPCLNFLSRAHMTHLTQHAEIYMDMYRQHWHRTKGAVKWVCSQGKPYFEKLSHKINYLERAPEGRKEEVFSELMSLLKLDVKIPDMIFNCHRCKQGKGLKIMRCERCKCVGYCSRECQLTDWEDQHKKQCKKLRKEREAGNTKGQLEKFKSAKDTAQDATKEKQCKAKAGPKAGDKAMTDTGKYVARESNNRDIIVCDSKTAKEKEEGYKAVDLETSNSKDMKDNTISVTIRFCHIIETASKNYKTEDKHTCTDIEENKTVEERGEKRKGADIEEKKNVEEREVKHTDVDIEEEKTEERGKGVEVEEVKAVEEKEEEHKEAEIEEKEENTGAEIDEKCKGNDIEEKKTVEEKEAKHIDVDIEEKKTVERSRGVDIIEEKIVEEKQEKHKHAEIEEVKTVEEKEEKCKTLEKN